MLEFCYINSTKTKTKNSKLLKDLNIRHDTIKLLEEDIGNTFSNANHSNVLLGQSPKAIEIKQKSKHKSRKLHPASSPYAQHTS